MVGNGIVSGPLGNIATLSMPEASRLFQLPPPLAVSRVRDEAAR